MKITVPLILGLLPILTSCNGQSSNSKAPAVLSRESAQHPIPMKKNNLQGDTVKQLGSSIMVIYQDKKNNYWFGSWKTGLYRYDGRNLINYTTKHGLYIDRVDDIKEDQSGNIYISGMNTNATITRFDGKSFTPIRAIPSKEWQLGRNDLWLLNHHQTKQKVYRFDGHTLYELTLPKPPGLDHPFDVYSIYKDRKGNIWFGTSHVGVGRYDGKSFQWITEEDVTELLEGGKNGVRSVTEDKNGDFWFNTAFRYRISDSPALKNNQFYTRHGSIGSLDGKNTSGLQEYISAVRDKDNHLWFATYRDGVWKYDGSKITHYPVQEQSQTVKLFSIYRDHSGDLWLGTHENGAYKFNGKTFEKFKP